MNEYDPKEIEKKWQEKWEKSGIYHAKDKSDKPKYYSLIEFPYPSGDGLHVGHPRPYIGLDVVSRKRRMQGYNVLYPIGWDAFGLPTENYAIKTGKDPRVVTKENTDTFRRQIQSLGISFDWSREINTTDPKYYKWTQWIFLKFLEKGLAYKAKTEINWCPKDKIGLANEEVIDGRCERCGTEVEKREKEQWMLAITKYADRLHGDLDDVDYPERVKIQQKNWIGRSEGAELDFEIADSKRQVVKVFTTRPDTIFGATYLVLAPEHPEISSFKSQISNWKEVDEYIEKTKKRTDIERTADSREKTGVRLEGMIAINPASKEEIPVFIADYVLPHYGTGAIMAVPAHDSRDYEFASKFRLPIKEVVIPERIDKRNPPVQGKKSVERRNVHAIVKNPKDGKVIVLKWKHHPWNTFPMGGVDDGEDIIDAAKREVLEETGYKDLANGKVIGGQVRAEYFAAHKDENRVAYTSLVSFDLASEERDEISAEEDNAHEVLWMEESELTPEFMTHAEMDVWIDRLTNGHGAYTGNGVLINSGDFSELDSEEASKKIAGKFGKSVITYKLRDWVFSRQRYWGEPIPVVHCGQCGVVPVPEQDLPVLLPKVENYQPTDTGESPLANISEWVNTRCPKCEGDAERETDVMPNWAGSSWYFLRYMDPNNNKEFASEKNLKYWAPVDWYNGGMEHTTLHLLYSRFWNKFLFDLGLVPESEPYKKRTSHGLILAEGGEKMSKSKGNVVNPDKVVEQFGADTLRIYEMFMGPFEQAVAWSEDSLVGPRRFLEKVWRMSEKLKDSTDDSLILHETIKKVTEDVEALGFNTAVSALMILVNDLDKRVEVSKSEFETMLLLLAPLAPHITEELWQSLGHKDSIHFAKWPEYDESKIERSEAVVVVQVNGKKRGEFTAPIDIKESEAFKTAKSLPDVTKWIEDKEVKKMIYVPGKIVSIVV
ncbi:MAG: class I tRNA ligase family protein [Thermodesulfobacteriota bacterium]